MLHHPRIVLSSFFLLLFTFTTKAQKQGADSSKVLKEVLVKAHLTEQPLARLTTSVGLVDSSLLNHTIGTTLLPALNTIPGLRMEERSPGSYRLSIRGSLLRSPFGVRNVKVYFDEMPLTDAGGNTYLNSLDAGSMSSINILKGPDGSLFGANSGGVVMINPNGTGIQKDEVMFGISRGSFASTHQQFSAAYKPSEKYGFSFNQSIQDADGYRENSKMKRIFFQTVQRWNYTPNNELRVLAFYSDLRYRTPGGLNESQYEEDPKAARPPAGPNPGVAEQQAGIINKSLFGGVVHEMRINNRFKHLFTVFGTHTDFTNPFITNYEIRKEKNVGFRTYLNYSSKPSEKLSWQLDGGMELQSGSSTIHNYDNNAGNKGADQAADALRNGQHFYFARFSSDIYNKLFIEASASLNYNHFNFRQLYPNEEQSYSKLNFDPEWMPRLAFSYLFNQEISWRASVARGYSPATTAEVRSSDNIINTDLQAETGWNFETGLRLQNRFIQADVSAFRYKMKDAIVRQLRENGAEFFNNAGGVDQLGLEATFSSDLISNKESGFIRSAQLSTNLTLSKFKFEDYESGGNDFSGNKLTGVPSSTLVSYLFATFQHDLGLFFQHNYTSSIPLNDGNTVYAKAYHLVQVKAMWTKELSTKTRFQLFAGIDNLLNEKYSLGNDINAFGARYFNAAPTRNYFAGLSLSLL
jgi:iron complex outermembrane receptor protein